MKTLVVRVSKGTRDNYELVEGWNQHTTYEDRKRYNEYKENVQYLKNRINKFGYVGVAL